MSCFEKVIPTRNNRRKKFMNSMTIIMVYNINHGIKSAGLLWKKHNAVSENSVW